MSIYHTSSPALPLAIHEPAFVQYFLFCSVFFHLWVSILSFLYRLFLYPLICSTNIAWLPPGCRFYGINCWSCSGIFLVALVYFPPFLISCLSLLYSIGNKVKKDFQGVTLKGSQKLSTSPFTWPMKTQVYRASMWLSLVLIKTYSSPSSLCFNLSTRYIIDNKYYLDICIILWLNFFVCKMGIVLLLTSYSSSEN